MSPGAGVDGGTRVDRPRRVGATHPDAAAGLGALWTAVTRAGGAVGFATGAPEEAIRAAAAEAVEDVRAGRQVMLVVGPEQAPVGTVFLRRETGAVRAHRADLLRLMVHPDRQGRGLGGALLDAAVAHARELGLELLLLSTRGGTALPDYYTARGWTPVGVWPGALRLAPDDVRDEHWFLLPLE